MPNNSFPKDFLWGASTASHQVEGGTHNQWSVWEQENAQRLASTAKDRLGWLPSWPDIAQKAQDPTNYISGNGVEHYTRYKEDFALLRELHMQAFRFGIEWSRIEPRSGQWDKDAITHYKTYIAELKSQGITPVLTLWHWTMPTWFTDMGGFEKKANLVYFERYVQKVADLFAQDIPYVITLNEPNVYTGFSYGTGEWPPQYKRPLLGLRVYCNLVKAHKKAYTIMKRANPSIQVGVSAQLSNALPVSPRNPINRLVVAVRLYAWNWWFLNRIKGQQDFIGINYYFTDYVDWRGRVKNPTTPVSNLGWYMEPAGIENLLVQAWKRYRTPIIIAENGLADSKDAQRQWWLEQTLPALEQALQRGVKLQGYLHWSLLDNFEWAYGWWPKFGLVSVDRKTMKRTVRPSAQWLAKKIKSYRLIRD